MTLLMLLMALQALKLQLMMVCRYDIDSGLRKYRLLFIGVTISLLGDVVNINEGENSTTNVTLELSMPAEREVPFMLRIMLRSTFSSMYVHVLITIIIRCYLSTILDESDIRVFSTPMSSFSLQETCFFILLEAVDDQIAEDTEVFDVVVEAVNPLDSVSSMNTSTVYIFDNDGNLIYQHKDEKFGSRKHNWNLASHQVFPS